MPKTRFIQNSFVSGVLSPLLKGRTDIKQYYQGLETGRNWILLPQGGAKRRPGTKYIDKALPKLTRNATVPTMPEGGTAANINDDSDATSATTTTNIGVLDPYVVAKYDLGAAVFIELVDVRGIKLTVSGTSTEFKIQHSSDDITYIDAADVPLIGVSDQDFRLKTQISARYWRLARIGATDLTTNKVTLEEFNLWEKQATLSESKLKDFSVTTSRHYLLSITDGNIRIYNKDGTHAADLKAPYLSAEVSEIRDVQTESVMLLVHENHPVKRIINLGTNADWTIDDAPFSNLPQIDYNDSSSPTPVNDVQVMTFTAFVAGDTFQIDIEGVLSKNITFAGDATADERSATAKNIEKNIQDMPVVGDTGVAVARTGANQYTITISGESANDFELFSAFATSGTASKTIAFTHSATGVSRKEAAWSSGRGYPKTACFHEGRLVIGGTKSKPQSLFFSRSGDFFNFDITEADDDDAIFTTISSRRLTSITDVFPGRTLQVFTAGAEFAVLSKPVTPAAIGVTLQTSHGTQYLEAKEIDGATIIADRNGKTIREFLYNFNEDAYVANDVSVLSPELIKTPVDIAILGGSTSEDANWIFIINNDGSATVLNTLRSQDINGFTEWTTSGFITNASVVDDALFMVNKRTIGGVESHFIEEWRFDYLLDNSIKVVNSPSSATASGLSHLEGETVRVVADGAVMSDAVVSSGVITLDAAKTNIEVGVGFVSELKTMPLNTNIGSGENGMRLKRIVRMNIRVKDATGVYVEGVPVPVRAFGDAAATPLGSAPAQKTGIIDDVLSAIGWQRDDMPAITLPDPTPATILAIEYEVESS